MSALDAAQRERQHLLLTQFKAAVQETREMTDGYAFRLKATSSIIQMVSEWITVERLCCPFLRFELVVGPETWPVWLKLTGREGVKEFIAAEIGIVKGLGGREG